jgi:hypothetical protein
MTKDNLSSKKLILEIFSCYQLSEFYDRPLKKLFQFIIDIIDIHRIGIVIDFSFIQVFVDKSLFYNLNVIVLIQINSQNYIEILEPLSFAEIDNENLSNFNANIYPSPLQSRSILWIEDYKFNLNINTIEVRNRMIDI